MEKLLVINRVLGYKVLSPVVRLLIPIPFAGIWGMLGSLPEGSLGKAFYQAAFFLSHPGEIGRLLAGDGAGGGMFILQMGFHGSLPWQVFQGGYTCLLALAAGRPPISCAMSGYM